MAKHVWTVLCRRSVIDRDSNAISLFDAVEALSFAGPVERVLSEASGDSPPLIPAQMELVSFWTRSDPKRKEKARARYVLVTPRGKTIVKSENQLDLMQHQRVRHRLTIDGLPFLAEPGTYEWKAQLRGTGKSASWRTVARIPFDVRINDTSLGENNAQEAETQDPRGEAP
jgi:hypothetical protein